MESVCSGGGAEFGSSTGAFATPGAVRIFRRSSELDLFPFDRQIRFARLKSERRLPTNAQIFFNARGSSNL